MGKWFIEPVHKLTPSSERIIQFKGLNRRPVIDDGEMRDMLNLSSDDYPCLTQRRARAIYSDGETGDVTYVHPVQMLVKAGRLMVLDEQGADTYRLYYDGQLLKTYQQEQIMVGMNDHVVFFPAKERFNARPFLAGNTAVFTSLEAEVRIASATIDTTNNQTHTGTLLTVSPDIDLSGFADEDVVSLTGTLTWDGGTITYTNEYPVACLVNGIEPGKILLQEDIFLELYESGQTTATMTNIRMWRACPNLVHVMEYGNRLWGVCDDDNTIRCCKLGDPTNWEYFQGESIDAFAATQGTEGVWTGCVAYSSHLLFFKEKYIHKVYGLMPSEFQIVTQEAHGVEVGSTKSIAVLEDYVFYKSRNGITVYAGDKPELVSASFGANTYKHAVAGTTRRKLYMSMMNQEGVYEMLVFDAAERLWHREDYTQAVEFCFFDEMLLFADNEGVIWAVDEGDDATTRDMEWFAELGPFDEYVENKKVVSKLKARYTLEEGSALTVEIKCDDGDWEFVDEFSDERERAGVMRIVPRRCDKYSIRLSGRGRCRVEGLLRQYREARGRY